MVSEKKLAANRANAQKSTGPKTPEGKARSSLNASTHGIFCRDLVLPGENEAEFIDFREQFITALAPRDIMELSLVDEIVTAKWKLRRVQKAEKILHATRADALDDLREDASLDLLRDLHFPWRKDDSGDEQKLRQRQRELAAIKIGDIDAGTTLAVMLGDEDQSLDRLSRYEQRLHYTAHRCHRELMQLRKGLAKTHTPSIYSAEHQAKFKEQRQAEESKREPEPMPDSPSAAQNEPTAGEKTRKTDPDCDTGLQPVRDISEEKRSLECEDRTHSLEGRVTEKVHGRDTHAT